MTVVIENVDAKSPAEVASDAPVSETKNTPAETPTAFNSIGELREKAPQLYQKILECLALDICREMQHHQERMKRIMRENSRH